MPKHIGIVGCSAEGAALCYRTLCHEAGDDHPEITMHTPPLAAYMACLSAGDMAGVADLMLRSARVLAEAGADLLICPDNTIHQAWPLIETTSPLPWLHIADPVAQEATRLGLRRVGLLGTRWLVESDVYPKRLAPLGIETVTPDVPDRVEIDRLIFDDLVPGIFSPAAAADHERVITRLVEQGCQAIVMGCTEIPILMEDRPAPVPLLDSTRLLAMSALGADL